MSDHRLISRHPVDHRHHLLWKARLKQDCRIKQLEYELALLKLNQTESVTSQVEEAKMAYEQATRDFQSFWDNKLPTD